MTDTSASGDLVERLGQAIPSRTTCLQAIDEITSLRAQLEAAEVKLDVYEKRWLNARSDSDKAEARLATATKALEAARRLGGSDTLIALLDEAIRSLTEPKP